MCRRPGSLLLRSASTSATLLPSACTYTWLPASRRKGVGIYTVTDISLFSSQQTSLPLHRKIALAGIGQDGDHPLALTQPLRHFESGEHVRPGRDPHQQPFLAGEPSGKADRVLVAHGDDLVQHLAVEDARGEASADPLDGGHASPPALEHGRSGGLHTDDEHARDLLLQDLTHAGDGAARAYAHHARGQP